METLTLDERHPLGIERLTPGTRGDWYTNERQDDEGHWLYDVWRVNDARTAQSIKDDIDAQINAETDHKILTGYSYQGLPVWLSDENQRNFTGLHLAAITTNGAVLPITAKIGEKRGKPVYHTFESVQDVAAFYLGGVAHINACLAEGQARKDAIQVTL